MRSPPASPHLIDVAGMAALAFIVACTSHEVLGHGAACLSEGGRITLLTSVYFHCDNAGSFTDLAGPLANLSLGVAAYALLERRAWSENLRLFLVLVLAFNLFWFAGCMLVSAIASTSDFASVLRAIAVNPPWLGRGVLGGLGLLVYSFGMRAISKHVGQGTALAFSYAVAGLVSCGAALFFTGPVAPAVREAALESFGSAIGLLLLAGRRSPGLSQSSPAILSARRYGWLVAGALASSAFFWILGRGLVVR